MQQLKNIIQRLEQILDDAQQQPSPQFQLKLHSTYQTLPNPMQSFSSLDKSLKFDELMTQDNTKQDYRRLSLDTQIKDVDYQFISSQLKIILQGSINDMNIEQFNQIQELFEKETAQNSYGNIIQNQIYLIETSMLINSICSTINNQLQLLLNDKKLQEQITLQQLMNLRNQFHKQINYLRINQELLQFNHLNNLYLIQEQQQLITTIDNRISQAFTDLLSQ